MFGPVLLPSSWRGREIVSMKKTSLILALVGIVMAVSFAVPGAGWAGVPGTAADAGTMRAAREARRAAEWKVPEIFRALGVRHGSRVADIGCGEGFLTLRLASVVGPEGKVFAVDVDAHALGELRKRIEESGATNIEVVRSGEADPRLVPASLDGAVVLRAYHEFSRYRDMLAGIRTALRPGGRFVIVDVEPAGTDTGGSRERQFSRHVLAYSIAEADVVEAGFRVILSLPSFARLSNGETVWLLAAERPLAGPPLPLVQGAGM
jgi:precorrin-6B methylase 2